MTISVFPLTLFYDSYCPLCVSEMELLRKLDVNSRLRFEDIHAPDFPQRYPHIDPASANSVLHAEYDDGSMIFGLDVTHQAWATVNHKSWLVILRWPLIRWFADLGYRIFARHRYSISYLLTGTRRCDLCVATDERGEQSNSQL